MREKQFCCLNDFNPKKLNLCQLGLFLIWILNNRVIKFNKNNKNLHIKAEIEKKKQQQQQKTK